MTDKVFDLIDDIRREIRDNIAKLLIQGAIDNYEEKPYDEENRKYIIAISFNAGDVRTLEIILDIGPDTYPDPDPDPSL